MGAKRKLTDAQIIEIKQYIKEDKVKLCWICKEYNISKQYLNHIKNHGLFNELDKYVN